MIRPIASSSRKPLYLTEQEALALLEMCLLTAAEEKEAHAGVLMHLSGLCREFLRAHNGALERLAIAR